MHSNSPLSKVQATKLHCQRVHWQSTSQVRWKRRKVHPSYHPSPVSQSVPNSLLSSWAAKSVSVVTARGNVHSFVSVVPIKKNEAMNNIEPSFTSPKVVGISPKIPPVGLLSGESNINMGSHKTRMREKLQLIISDKFKAFGVMRLSSNRTP